MKEKNPTATITKRPHTLGWQVAVRHLPASPKATPDGCSDCSGCSCDAPLRQPPAAVSK